MLQPFFSSHTSNQTPWPIFSEQSITFQSNGSFNFLTYALQNVTFEAKTPDITLENNIQSDPVPPTSSNVRSIWDTIINNLFSWFSSNNANEDFTAERKNVLEDERRHINNINQATKFLEQFEAVLMMTHLGPDDKPLNNEHLNEAKAEIEQLMSGGRVYLLSEGKAPPPSIEDYKIEFSNTLNCPKRDPEKGSTFAVYPEIKKGYECTVDGEVIEWKMQPESEKSTSTEPKRKFSL